MDSKTRTCGIEQPDIDVIIRMNSEYNRVYRKTRNGGKAMRAAIGEWITVEQEKNSHDTCKIVDNS